MTGVKMMYCFGDNFGSCGLIEKCDDNVVGNAISSKISLYFLINLEFINPQNNFIPLFVRMIKIQNK